MNVLVLGASNKPSRYSYKAVEKLQKAGHRVFPVHPNTKEVLGTQVFPSINDVKEPIDTVTLYVSAERSQKAKDDILGLKPRRIIFNPGAENPDLKAAAERAGIESLNACTLVLLSTAQF